MANPIVALRNAVLGWFDTAGNGTYSPAVGATSEAGAIVNESSALKLAAVWACTRLISETIATLPVGVYQRMPNGSKRYALEHPLHRILSKRPAPGVIAPVMWESFVAAMLLRGNALCERLEYGGRLVGLRFLAPHRLAITRTYPTGARRYFYTDDNGLQREIQASSIWRVPGFSIDGDWGVDVLWYGANVIGTAQAADLAASGTMRRGLMPTVAFQYPGALKGQQREDAREYILEQSGAVNSGSPVILEHGMTAQTLGIDPKSAQLLETRQYNREDVCSWFRVPPWMVGYGEKSTAWGTGLEQIFQMFITMVLRPWLVRIETAAALDLLPIADQIAGYYVQYNVEGLLRGDSAARAAFYDKMIKAAVMKPDEAREYEDMPAVGGNADELMINSATVLVKDLGAPNDTAQPQSGSAAGAPADPDSGNP